MNDLVVLPWAPHLEARLAGHAVAQRADFFACDLQARHVEELELRRRLTCRLANHFHRARALDLVAIQDGVALSIERVVVSPDAHVVAARRRVIVEPVDGRRNTDGLVLVVLEVEQDVVADHIAVVVDRHELLRHVDREVRDAIDRELADHLQRVTAFDIEVGHVVRLIEQNRSTSPGQLLVAPVREFLHHARHHGRRSLRLPQQLDRVARLLNRFF